MVLWWYSKCIDLQNNSLDSGGTGEITRIPRSTNNTKNQIFTMDCIKPDAVNFLNYLTTRTDFSALGPNMISELSYTFYDNYCAK